MIDLTKRLAAVAVLGLSLGACAAMGTTVAEDDPETELPTPSMGRSIMESLGAVPSRQMPINYSPRAPLVVPPSTAALAPPEDRNAVAANWPVDPEVETARRLREADRRAAARAERNGEGESAAIPPSELLATRVTPRTGPVDPQFYDGERDPAQPLRPSQLKGPQVSLSSDGIYDQSGTPRRRALVEPPVTYLQPAPNAPISEPEPTGPKKGIFNWFSGS
ncbi:hypothetical protein [Chthonobacter rhizosphaerae]|uniref:hypothetical protein n=1 Tax=Chthonobacter rhizosphaerae TaxID=2735553 RepID=UPI0015EF0C20|nr:hypothetical protein [Chthonobacter rhizosphaerae]